jgi:hypothetical protein
MEKIPPAGRGSQTRIGGDGTTRIFPAIFRPGGKIFNQWQQPFGYCSGSGSKNCLVFPGKMLNLSGG